MKNNNNVVWYKVSVTRQMREALNGHRSIALWFTGLYTEPLRKWTEAISRG